jgi:hypothetical protein
VYIKKKKYWQSLLALLQRVISMLYFIIIIINVTSMNFLFNIVFGSVTYSEVKPAFRRGNSDLT